MSEVREEYTRETYPSFGKKYNGEKAIISLTSWRARINTVSKTRFSLLKQCPGFHIVLVLSEEEFPKMMDELPETLKLFVENELIEILWVYKNYKSFKKILFTMDKYRDVPVISADDGCLYIRNFAEELYKTWLKQKENIISIAKFEHYGIELGGGGCGILYPPNCFSKFDFSILTNIIINSLQDDGFIGCLAKSLKLKYYFIYPKRSDFLRNCPYTDFNDSHKNSVWTNSSCSDKNIIFYKRIFNL